MKVAYKYVNKYVMEISNAYLWRGIPTFCNDSPETTWERGAGEEMATEGEEESPISYVVCTRESLVCEEREKERVG